jgi:glutaredoxin 3
VPNIEIYTTTICPFCHAAKRLLAAKGAVFSEISLSKEPELRDAMIARA